MVLFTHNVKKIKGAAHKNVDIDYTCKGGLNVREFVKGGWAPEQLPRNVFVPPESFSVMGGGVEVMGTT